MTDHGASLGNTSPVWRRAWLVDNFLDAAHFPFVPAASFGVHDDQHLDAGAVTTGNWRLILRA